MEYINLVGKVVKIMQNQFMSGTGYCYVFKAKSVSKRNACVIFTVDCYIRISPRSSEFMYIDCSNTPVSFTIYNNIITEANEETLAHCRCLLKDDSKYYKLIGKEFIPSSSVSTYSLKTKDYEIEMSEVICAIDPNYKHSFIPIYTSRYPWECPVTTKEVFRYNNNLLFNIKPKSIKLYL